MSFRMHRFLLAFGASCLLLLPVQRSSADEFDLTTSGATATINNALYQQGDVQASGTGMFNVFLRIQANGQATVESGFNTDFRPPPLDDKNDAPHNHSLLLSDVGIVTIDSTSYRQFALDIGEPQNSNR